jgi:ParB family chromosome partitioning protein
LQQLLQAGRLSTGHARALLGVDKVTVQRRIARKVIDQDLSVRATERLVKRATEFLPVRTGASKRPSRDPNVQSAENKLRRQLGTHVRIIHNANNQGGRIEVDFYSDGDLERLYDLLIK